MVPRRKLKLAVPCMEGGERERESKSETCALQRMKSSG